MVVTEGFASRVQDAARSAAGDLPVKEVQVRPYVDWSGDDALQVFVILDERASDEDWSWQKLEPVDRAIHDIVQSSGSGLYPYIRFVTAAQLTMSPDDSDD